jgi:hypothetical protein
VAFADDVGASVLVNRIRSQFERHGHLVESGITISIAHELLSPQQGGVEMSADMLISTLASTLETAIESQILKGAVQHE